MDRRLALSDRSIAFPDQSRAALFSPRSEHLEASSEHLPERSEHLAVTSEHYQELLKIAGVVREKGKAGKDIVKKVILQLCADDYLSLRTLSDLLNRAPDSIRNHYLSPMLAEGLLKLRYPQQPNHPQQGYKSVSVSS
jgi:ATP-dependent DNA helicase RecG